MTEAGSPGSQLVAGAAADLGLALSVLRSLKGLSQKELAAVLGMHTSRVSRLEAGHKTPNAAELDGLLAASSAPSWAFHHVLLPFLASFRQLLAPGVTLLPGDARRASQQSSVSTEITTHGLNAFVGMLVEMDLSVCTESKAAPPAVQELTVNPWADAAAPILAGAVQLLAWPPFEGMTLRLCEDSVEAATSSAANAHQLATLAVQLSQHAPGPPAWRQRLGGYARAFVGNALRVHGRLRDSDSTFATAWRQWQQGEDPPSTQMAEWRMLHLEASVRRDLRQFGEAIALLDRALALAPAEAHAKILCTKALAFEQAGETEEALHFLAEAERRARPSQSSLSWSLRFNRAVLLCHRGDYCAADRLTPQLDTEARERGDDLNSLRVLWVRSRVSQGLGDSEAAVVALEQLRIEFCRREMPFDAALASLELAAAYLETRRYVDVQRVAAELGWVFNGLTVQREALAALQLFRQAAQANKATLAIVTSALRKLGDERPVAFPGFDPGS